MLREQVTGQQRPARPGGRPAGAVAGLRNFPFKWRRLHVQVWIYFMIPRRTVGTGAYSIFFSYYSAPGRNCSCRVFATARR